MIGAICGDVVGSVFEFRNIKRTDFKLFDGEGKSTFTDDTVMTIACADAILHHKDYASSYRYWGKKYPNRGYGGTFNIWLGSENPKPYNSYGNGSAMRVSPVGFAFNTLEEVLSEARRSAEVSHNHPEGIKGGRMCGFSNIPGTSEEKQKRNKRIH